MAATSINIQPVKGGSEQHNKREKNLDYVRPELSHLNESWEIDTISNRLQVIKSNYEKATGQKMQKKATPIREGVVVIQKDTTMQQLQDFAKKAEARFGIKAFQIYTHKDEGHVGSKEWTPNYHAHIVFDWTTAEGKSCKLNRQDMAELQTILSTSLGMERGKSSDKKHLDAIQFKNEREKEKNKALKEEAANIQTKKSVKEAVFKTSEKFKDLLGMTTNDREKEALKKANESLKKENSTLKVQIGKANTALQEQQRQIYSKDNNHQFLTQKYNRLTKEIDTLKDQMRAIGKELHQLLKNVPEENLKQIKERLPAVGEILNATDEREQSRGFRR